MKDQVYILALEPDTCNVFGFFKMRNQSSLFLHTAGLVEYFEIPQEMYEAIENIDLTKKRLKFVDQTVYESDL